MKGIEWTDMTWNPLLVRNGGRFGCTKISAGCTNCYASRLNARVFGGRPYDSKFAGWDFYLDERQMKRLPGHKHPKKVFVCSATDLFHEAVPDELVYRVFHKMAYHPWHTFFVLTKRADRMATIYPKIANLLVDRLDHVQLMVTVENQAMANLRIPQLLSLHPGKVGVSVEPLLEPIDFRHDGHYWLCGITTGTETDVYGNPFPIVVPSRSIDFVIVGGESGPGARICYPAWIHDIMLQCRDAGVPVFVKQLGSRWAYEHKLRDDSKGSNPENWPADLRVREFPT